MNTTRPLRWILAIAVTACSVTSCSIEHLSRYPALAKISSLIHRHGGDGAPLQHGVKYEVRPAIAAGVPFQRAQMKRYYFVMAEPGPPRVAPRPPMAAARKTYVVHRKAIVTERPVGSPPEGLPEGNRLTVRTTAYCHDESDHIVYGRMTAVGTRLKYGAVRSAAADWSRYPVGTRFRIAGQPDVVYEVDDYGSALVGTGTIDLYHPTRSAMNKWGVRHVDIEVIEWGSFEESVNIMSDRTRWPHVRRMLNDIQNRVSEVTAEAVKPAASPVVL